MSATTPGGVRTEFPKPILGVSDCLEFAACRYDGGRIRSGLVKELEPHVDYRPVCPEVGMGLGIPRDPIRVVRGGQSKSASALRLVQPATGRDLTDDVQRFSADHLNGMGQVDGFVLKSKSPSCGPANVKIFDNAWARSPSGTGSGFFAAAVRERHGDAAIEDEGRLRDLRLREHFLTRIFASARMREVVAGGRMAHLIRHHASYKFLLLAYSERGLRDLGWVAANPSKKPVDDVMAEYASGFLGALGVPPRRRAFTNVFQHIYGFFLRQLDLDDRRHFADQLARFREERLPASAIATLLESWAVRFGSAYILGQALFAPFPPELAGESR